MSEFHSELNPQEQLLHETFQDVEIITMTGEFDMEVAVRLDRTLKALVQNGARKLLLDLTEVTYMLSTGYRAIENASLRLSLSGEGKLCMACPTHNSICRIFKLLRMDDIVLLFETREAALNALA